MIEDSSKIVCGIEEDAWEHLRQCVRELDFVQILRGVRIFINEFGPWIAIDEFVNSSIKITDVMLCADECQAGTVEQISHDGIRPRQRTRNMEGALALRVGHPQERHSGRRQGATGWCGTPPMRSSGGWPGTAGYR